MFIVCLYPWYYGNCLLLWLRCSAGIANACRHSMDVSKSMEYFLATGNLVSRTGLGLMQVGLIKGHIVHLTYCLLSKGQFAQTICAPTGQATMCLMKMCS